MSNLPNNDDSANPVPQVSDQLENASEESIAAQVKTVTHASAGTGTIRVTG